MLNILYHYETTITNYGGYGPIVDQKMPPLGLTALAARQGIKHAWLKIAIWQFNFRPLRMKPVPARSLVAGHRCPTISDI